MAVQAIHDYREMQIVAAGQRGTTLITDTAAHSGEVWRKVTILSDAVFTAITDATRDGNTFSGEMFPAGVDIYGRISVITLASGKVLAYKSDG